MGSQSQTTQTNRSKTIPCAHMEPFSTFKSPWLVLRVAQRRQKQSPEAKTLHQGRHTGHVEESYRIAKPLALGIIPAAVVGRAGSDDTATSHVGVGGLHGRKWSPKAKKRACMLPAGSPRQAHRVRPISAAVVGLTNRGDEIVRISWDISRLEIWKEIFRYLQVGEMIF
jgi:hypothetical protein